MSSINPYPTFSYSQPSEYRFSHDSVFLARRVFELLKNRDLSSFRILDLCSGCGIIGLDFLFHLKNSGQKLPATLDFVEIQELYKPHFEMNLRALGPVSTQVNYLSQGFQDLIAPFYKNSYDLILANPPYFETHEGTLSPNDFKNRCRFFIDGSSHQFFHSISNLLKPQGEAYVLFRQALTELPGLDIESLDPIRGTGLYLLKSRG